MSQVNRFPPDDPREWLNRAHSNLVRARVARGVDGVYFEDVCFDAQQAAEKAIKAVLVSRHMHFPRVHDIARLLTMVGEQGIAIPAAIADATDLTDYATVGRYPGYGEPVTGEDCDAAIACAEAVVRWASEIVEANA